MWEMSTYIYIYIYILQGIMIICTKNLEIMRNSKSPKIMKIIWISYILFNDYENTLQIMTNLKNTLEIMSNYKIMIKLCAGALEALQLWAIGKKPKIMNNCKKNP